MKSGKHILMITPGFPYNEEDSTCIPALQDYIKALKNECPEYIISVISLQYPFSNKPYQWKGIQVYPCGGKNGKGWRRFKTWWTTYRYFRTISKTNKPDIIHSFWLTEAALLGSFFSFIKKTRHICTFMGQDAKAGNKYLPFIMKRNLKLVFPSHFCAETFGKHIFTKDPLIIPWGVDLNDFAASEPDAKSIDILGVGSLVPLKRFDVFLAVIAALKKNFPTIQAVLIGDGSETKNLTQEIQKYGLQDNLKLTAKIPRNEVLQYMAKSRILLHPSEYESFGVVFAEALNSNMCIVSRKVGIAEASARWLLANNMDEFASQTASLLRQTSHIENTHFFDIKDTVKSYLALYQ